MNSFLIAITVVCPLLIYMMVGAGIQKLGIMSKENFKALNTMIFKIFIPLGVFFDIYETNLGDVLQIEVFVFAFVGILMTYLIGWGLITKAVKENDYATVMIQGLYRSNYALFGISIAKSICDSEGVALTAALSAMVVPMFNILAVILFEVKRGGEIKIGRVLINIMKNPLVVAGILGGIFAATGIRIPELITTPLQKLGSTATPIALVTLGGLLSKESVARHRKYLMITVLGRLVIVPAIALGTAILLGMRGNPLVTLLAVFGSPTAVSSAPMAQTMGGNGELAGEIVASTSVCCIITVFLFVFTMSQMGWI